MPADEGGAAYRLPVRRWLGLSLALSVVLIFAVLSGLVAVSWRSLDRLQPIREHAARVAQLEDVALVMEQTLLEGLRGGPVSPARLTRIREALLEIEASPGSLAPRARGRLDGIAERLAQPASNPLDTLYDALARVREVLARERERHDLRLTKVARDTTTELQLATGLLVVLPLGGAVALFLLQRRAKQPLQDLEDLLSRLAARDYQPVPESVLDGTDKLAQPAFQSYNALVTRLQELEAEHRDRERTLVRRVRQATEALLAQSRELARAERLAAVGAVSAGLAHELRNPLAGIQMACTKLRRSLGEGEHSARIAAVIAELKRVNHLLTEQVDAARHAPEPWVAVSVAALVDESLALVRYQLPEGVTLQAQVPPQLNCVLPVAGLRQALLNLLLNAVQSLGQSGLILVAARAAGNRLTLSVSDDGPGFPEEMLRTGIRPFATGKAQGTGLGLAMVRRFVRDHDGELELANRRPHGAEVTLHLPCKAGQSTGEMSHA